MSGHRGVRLFATLKTLQQAAGNVLPYGSAARDCKEFYHFFDSLANPAASCGVSARCAVQRSIRHRNTLTRNFG